MQRYDISAYDLDALASEDGEWVRYDEARAEIMRLQMELDASCNAEELRQVRADRDRAQARLAEALEEAQNALGYLRRIAT